MYGQKYGDSADLLWLFAFIPVLTGLSGVLGSALRARERPDCELWSSIIATIVSLALGAVLMVWLGVWGAAWTFVISYSVWIVSKGFFYFRTIPRSFAAGHEPAGTPAIAPVEADALAGEQ
jgi:O-antigen/teichoic acid export membrane protein